MTRQTLGIVLVVILGGLSAGPTAAQEVQLLEAYEEFEKMRELNEEKRHQRQLELLNASLDAYEKSLELMDDTAEVIERAATTGMLLAPDGSFARRLEWLAGETEAASERLARRWPAKGIRTVMAAREYRDKLEAADAELSRFLHDPNLPPEAGQGLAALRGIGMVLESLGDVPLVGDALEQYGELVATFTDTMRKNYRLLAPGGREGALLNSYSTDLRRGFPGSLPTETQVLRATRWNVPLLRDGTQGDYYLKVEKSWTRVDGPRISSIVSDWLVVYGQPDKSLVDQGVDRLKEAVERFWGNAAEAPDRSYPPSGVLLVMVDDARKKVFGLGISRRDLRQKAEERLALLADEREMREVLSGVPAFEEGRIDAEDYHETRKNLRATALRLGVPLSSKRQRNLMRDLYLDEALVWSVLREVAFRLHPGGEDFVRGLDLEPRSMDLFELATLLKEFRAGEALVPVRVAVRDSGTGRGIPGAGVKLVRAEGSDRGPQSGPLAVREGVTNGEGMAEIEVVRGHHFLSAVASGFDGGLPPRRTALTEAQPHEAVLTLTPPLVFEELLGTLVAQVREQGTNAPIPGARVSLQREGLVLEGSTDATGEVHIEEIPFGHWTLRAAADGFQSRSKTGFEIGPDDPDRKGRIPLRRLEPEVRPAKLPVSRLGSPAPEPETGACGFQPLGRWEESTAGVVNRTAKSASAAGIGATHPVDVPGPGRLRVTLVVTGKHENSNTRYEGQRYRSQVLIRSDPSVAGNGRLLGGEYYTGVRDSDETSDTFAVKGPGSVSLQFVPESCSMRKSSEGDHCWYPGATEAPGIKLHPMSYTLTVEFDACVQE